jgi:hypothetical protein
VEKHGSGLGGLICGVESVFGVMGAPTHGGELPPMPLDADGGNGVPMRNWFDPRPAISNFVERISIRRCTRGFGPLTRSDGGPRDSRPR